MSASHQPHVRGEAWAAESVRQVVERAERWLDSEALDDLVRRLDGPRGAPADRDSLLLWSAATLDTRDGAERREAAPVTWSDVWVQALLDAAAPLGLTFTSPPLRTDYDVALILGGATTGNRLRIALARKLVDAGARVGQLVGLAAERPLSARERETEPDSAQDESEWRNLRRHAVEAFGPLEPKSQRGGGRSTGAWRDELYASTAGLGVRLLVAPSPDPARRATTADAVDFFAREVPADVRRSILVITSAIYAPYQFFAAAPPLLNAGAEHAELVGTSSSADAPEGVRAQRIGQETHAAIETACRLLRRTG
jgi:hypothetical protein